MKRIVIVIAFFSIISCSPDQRLIAENDKLKEEVIKSQTQAQHNLEMAQKAQKVSEESIQKSLEAARLAQSEAKKQYDLRVEAERKLNECQGTD